MGLRAEALDEFGDVSTLRASLRAEALDAPKRVAGLTHRIVTWIGGPFSRRDARMNLHQVAAAVEADAGAIETDLELLSEVRGRDGVECVCNLHMMVGVHLGARPRRHVERRGRRGQHERLLFGLVHVSRDTTRGAVHARTGDVAAPSLGMSAGVVEGRERLAVEATLADIGDLVFDPWLVLRMAHTCRVDEEPACLGVLEKASLDAGVLGIGAHDGRRHVVGHDAFGTTAKEEPRRIQALAQRHGRLHQQRPDKHVPTRRQDHDQHPELAALALRVGEKADVSEVDLRFLPHRGIVDAHRRHPLTPTQLVMSKPPQRRVRDLNPIPRKQLAHAHEPQWALPAEPSFNPWTLRLELLVSLGRRRLGPRLHATGHLRHQPIVERRLVADVARARRLEVPKRRLSIHHSIARQLPGALPRLHAAENFSYVDHGQLPKAHRCLPAASRAVADWHRALALGCRARAPRRPSGGGPMRVATGWPHDRGEIYVTPPCGWPHDPGDWLAP